MVRALSWILLFHVPGCSWVLFQLNCTTLKYLTIGQNPRFLSPVAGPEVLSKLCVKAGCNCSSSCCGSAAIFLLRATLLTLSVVSPSPWWKHLLLTWTSTCSQIHGFFFVLFCFMFNLKCVYTLLIHSAFVLGTTPKGDTGGGPNWACKRDCPGSSNEHWSFCVRSITPSSDPFCAAGLQSPLWGFYKLVWDVDVNWENLCIWNMETLFY